MSINGRHFLISNKYRIIRYQMECESWFLFLFMFDFNKIVAIISFDLIRIFLCTLTLILRNCSLAPPVDCRIYKIVYCINNIDTSSCQNNKNQSWDRCIRKTEPMCAVLEKRKVINAVFEKMLQDMIDHVIAPVDRRASECCDKSVIYCHELRINANIGGVVQLVLLIESYGSNTFPLFKTCLFLIHLHK